jgi:catechol 1,2-dioxygenase
MSDHSRRKFLKWLGVSSGAVILSQVGCDRGLITDSGSTISSENGPDGGEFCEVTGGDILGPFFEPGAPQRLVLASAEEPGERLVIEGRISGPDCTTPVAGAVLDVWHADREGDYHGGEADGYRLRGQILSDGQGRYRFETIRPGHYPLGSTMRPAHIHISVVHPGFVPLTTQLYFAGDPHLAPNDPCGVCNSADPTLIIDLEGSPQDGWEGVFDIVLEEI